MIVLAHSEVTLPPALLTMMMAGSTVGLDYSYVVLTLSPLEQSNEWNIDNV